MFITRLGTKASRAVLILCLLVPVSSRAEVRQVEQFSFAQKQPSWTLGDLYGRFGQQALAFTAQGDLLIFSPRRTGAWELFRIQKWDTGKPAIDHLQLADYFSSHDQHDLEELTVKVYVTPDGAHAVCVGSAYWLKRVNGKAVGKSRTNNIITVVDLATFKTVKRIDTKSLDLLEFQSLTMDREGRILVSSSVFGDSPHGEFVQLAVPSLEVGQKCTYAMVKSGSSKEHAIPKTVDACRQDLGAVPLEEYLNQAASVPTASGFICKDTKAEYCPQPDRFTTDNRFGLGVRTEGHDGLLGGWVQTRSSAVLFSVKTHTEVGELDLTHSSPYIRLAAVAGKDFLVSVEAGSKLTVYQLIDSE